MKAKDGIGLWGKLQIWEETPVGRFLVYEDMNTVVDAGKVNVLQMLTGGTTDHLAEMAIGNGNVPNTPVDTTSTALGNEIDSKVFGSTNLDIINKIVEFRATFNSGDYAPGSFTPEEVNEAALMFNGSAMFSKKTFIARPFAIVDTIVMTFIWSVGVA